MDNRDVVLLSVEKYYQTIENIPEGRSIEHTFTIGNDRRQDVVIVGIENGCGCTSADISKMSLGPGERAKLHMQVDTKGRTGLLYAISTIAWRDAEIKTTKVLKVGLIVHVENIASLKPSNINFGAIRDTEPVQVRTTLLSHGKLDDSWDSVIAVPLGPNVDVKVENAETRYEVKISINPKEAPIGTFHERLELKFFQGQRKLARTLMIPVSGSIVSEIQSKPASVYYGAVGANEIVEKAIKIYAKQPSSLLSITSTNPVCATARMVSREGEAFAFTCRFNSNGLKDNQSGKFLITFSQEGKEKTIAIPFIAYVK